MSVLDSPLRTSLSGQSTQLRADLKIFERDFFAANARKPGKEDIKQNQDIAQKYKDYNKIRDVLSGKISPAALAANSATQDRKRRRSKHDEDRREEAGHSPRKRPSTTTPWKQFRTLHPDELDPYDAPPSASPRPQITELGPTPQRDGRVLGIFDLLEASGSAKGSTSKRQKHLGLFDEEQLVQSPSTKRRSPVRALSPSQARTPAKSRSKPNGDILDHLTGTPMTGHNRMRARTPASSAKKFMLNQFFTTPTAIRYATMLQSTDADGNPGTMTPKKADTANPKTPLLDRVLGRTPTKVTTEDITGDQTPAYLKRSFSFKQRLLSASTGNSRRNSIDESQESIKPSEIQRIAPSQRRKGKYNPRTLSQMAQEIIEREAEERRTVATTVEQRRGEEQEEDDTAGDDADDDEWEALREIEVNDSTPHDEHDDEDVLLRDSQAKQPTAEDQPMRKWKKKGQKRSTRRAIMRPSRVGVQDPNYRKDVEGSDDDASEAASDEDGDERVQETQLARPTHRAAADADVFSDDELLAEGFASDDGSDEEFGPASPVRMKTKTKKASTKNDKATATTKTKANVRKQQQDEYEAPARKINPNLQSHMNFRSLKIKNKNSKAKRGAGGRGRFGGKGRR